MELKHTLEQMDLDIYRKFHPTTVEYTLFSNAPTAFYRIDHIGHKTNLRQFKIKTIPNIFSDHSSMQGEINNRKVRRCTKYVEIKHSSKQPWGQRRNQKANLKPSQNKKKTKWIKYFEMQQKQFQQKSL